MAAHIDNVRAGGQGWGNRAQVPGKEHPLLPSSRPHPSPGRQQDLQESPDGPGSGNVPAGV